MALLMKCHFPSVIFGKGMDRELLYEDLVYGTDKGVKDDSEKPAMDLLEPEFITEMAEVLAFGARRYGRFNYRRGISTMRLLAAALRHTFAFLGGTDNDKDTGKSHLAHAACSLMMCHYIWKNKKEHDGRGVCK